MINLRGKCYTATSTGILLLFIFLIPASRAGDESDLIEFFRSQSVPVISIENKAGVALVKLNFSLNENPDMERLDPMLSMIFTKTAQAFPNSSRIRVDYSIENELISSLSMDTNMLTNPEGEVDQNSISFSEITVEATDQAMAIIHEGLNIQSSGQYSLEDLTIVDGKPRTDKKQFEFEDSKQQKKEMKEKLELLDDGRTPYLGAAFEKHNGEGIKVMGTLAGTPAENTGLRKGDLILEVENISLRDKGAQPELFSEMIKNIPVDRPVRFHIERNGKRFDVYIKLLNVSQEEREIFQKETNQKYRSDFDRGSLLFSQEKYGEAIEAFRKSMNEQPLESTRAIGVCYLYQNQFNVAYDYIVKAYKMNKESPESTFFLAVCCDNLGKINGAKYYYTVYLKMRYDNNEFNVYAQDRLDDLKKRKKRAFLPLN